MKENHIGKMKSLLVVILMLLSAMIVVFGPTILADDPAEGQDYYGKPAEFRIQGLNFTGNGNTNTSIITAANDTYVWGEIRISWDATNATYYYLRMDNAGNTSDGFINVTNQTYYDWDTTNLTDGVHYINVTAYGMGYSEDTGAGDEPVNGSDAWNDSVNGPIKIIVANTLPWTPGVDAFQGGNYTVTGWNNVDGGTCLSSNTIDYEVSSNSTNIRLSSGATWWSNSTYYLYYPVYNGSDRTSDLYDVVWKRYNSVGITSDADYAVTFDRAGIWVIDNREGLTNYETSDANFSTIALYNNTVPAWFWVNTSTDYTLDDLVDEFAYNTSGSLTLNVKDESGDQPTSGPVDPVVDIRYDDNKSSIRWQNIRATDWTYSSYYKNNSYGGYGWPGDKGFWSVGNYTVHAYIDTDRFGTGSDENGLQSYSEYTMDTTTNGWQHYNETYGANTSENGTAAWLNTNGTSTIAPRYNWRLCGPWDPPEHNVTLQYIRVTSGDPYAPVTQNSTVYYGFDGTVNITLKESSGGSAIDQTQVKVAILNDDDTNVTANFSIYESTGTGGTGLSSVRSSNQVDRPGRVTIYKTGGQAGWVYINMTNWGRNNTPADTKPVGANGTWKAIFWVDYNGDRGNGDTDTDNYAWVEEWNKTVSWKVKSAPSAQWRWVDDDGAVWDDANTDEIIPYIPNATNVPLDIQFNVFDSGGNTFGDLTSGLSSGICESITQCAENISITGNSLFTGSLSSFPGFTDTNSKWYASGVWHVPLIPTMSVGGGSVTIKVTAYNSTVTKTISIGGDNYDQNGSVVTVEPNDFKLDIENKTLSITAKFADDGTDIRTATVILYYLDDSIGGTIDNNNGKVGKPIVGHDVAWTGTWSDGYYTIPFNTTQQTFNQTTGLNNVDGAGFANIGAPRNLTVFVDGPGRRDGYGLIQMKPVNDLAVFIEGESEYTIMSGYEYDDFTISCNFTDSADTPSTKSTDKNNFNIKIVNIYGEDVTGSSNTDALLHNIYASKLTGSNAYSFEFDGVYGLDAGTYYMYAYNLTHNSEGHNATLIIQPVEVACDKAPFIWMSDKNISATFTITYDGSSVNGSLVIDNMSDVGTYNKTWTNCSFDGSTDAGGNTSMEIDDTEITDGVVTVNDITADALTENKSKEYITFWFKPSASPGAYARAKARINVEVPTVTPDPQYIPLGRTTKVYCTATGRGETLNDVYIRLHGQGFDSNSTTDVDGRVAFSITPASTGNISIDVGAEGRTLSDTVVYVVAWVIDASTDAEVNEGEQFTVTVVKEGTTDAVVDATVTITGIGTGTTDANGQATFTAPEVTSDRTYTIKVTKEGYAPDPDGLSITVVNIPRLTIVLPDEVQATTTFEVAVADDTGGAIVGAIITFNEKTYTTGVNGIAKLTAPKTKGDYPIKATFGNYVEATGIVTVTAAPGIPGFELLTLVAALGVAFILFRRRRRR